MWQPSAMKKLGVLRFHLLPFLGALSVLSALLWLNCIPHIPDYEKDNIDFLPGVYSFAKAERNYGWPTIVYISNSKRSLDFSRIFGIVPRNGWHIDNVVINVFAAIGLGLICLFLLEMFYRSLKTRRTK